ncbi:hypothetical protein A8C32_09825 [Flavivirga aquatica]|uniref:Uncharacterized protein n=1 Tax=Flavivirga aquatica TaxID=1849968 RepID=A0A1E5TEX3_9FLAO|nr:hypothetical protein A8C32_09825 [Flavivirga aquatica]
MPCLQKKSKRLPYSQKINIKTVQYSIMECSIDGVSDLLCGEEKLRYIPLLEKGGIDLILVPMDCGDFPYRYYLLTIKNNQVISSLYTEGEWYEPENIDNLESTSFEIDKDYIIKVKTENVNGDLGVNQTKRYEITKEGKIVEIK